MHISTQEEALAYINESLKAGIRNRNHPYHLINIATVGQDAVPQNRFVVLRGFDSNERAIRLHTDYRSAKVAQIVKNPNVSISMYDSDKKIQLCFKAKAIVHCKDEVARICWQDATEMSKRCYFSEFGPGTLLRKGSNEENHKEEGLGFSNFAVVLCYFYEVKILALSISGNKAILMRWDNGSNLAFDYIAP